MDHFSLTQPYTSATRALSIAVAIRNAKETAEKLIASLDPRDEAPPSARLGMSRQ